MLLGILGIGYQNWHCTYCEERILNTYVFQYWAIYIYRIGGQAILIVVSFTEVIILINRYHLLHGNLEEIKQVTVEYKITFVLIFILVVTVPEFFARGIVYIEDVDKYTTQLTDFGNSFFYSIFVVSIVGLYHFIILTSLKYL